MGYLRGTNADTRQVASDYDLPAEAVEAAMAYYRQHQSLIDRRGVVHAAAFVQWPISLSITALAACLGHCSGDARTTSMGWSNSISQGRSLT
ncbi:MAG: hypothetical protein LC793_04120 [Thermomicrobia bacterium]|nr:hypothetical protein [Thermomicrobia bacterium]